MNKVTGKMRAMAAIAVFAAGLALSAIGGLVGEDVRLWLLSLGFLAAPLLILYIGLIWGREGSAAPPPALTAATTPALTPQAVQCAPPAAAITPDTLLWFRVGHTDGGRTSYPLFPRQIAESARQCAANPTVMEIAVCLDDLPLARWRRGGGLLPEAALSLTAHHDDIVQRTVG